ncbi:hypothetical protein ACOSQ2_032109 [Xanthoceras sorbifolium]
MSSMDLNFIGGVSSDELLFLELEGEEIAEFGGFELQLFLLEELYFLLEFEPEFLLRFLTSPEQCVKVAIPSAALPPLWWQILVRSSLVPYFLLLLLSDVIELLVSALISYTLWRFRAAGRNLFLPSSFFSDPLTVCEWCCWCDRICGGAVLLGGFLAWVELSPILRLGSFPLGCYLVGGEWGRVWLWRSRSKLVLGGSKLGSVQIRCWVSLD